MLAFLNEFTSCSLCTADLNVFCNILVHKKSFSTSKSKFIS